VQRIKLIAWFAAALLAAGCGGEESRERGVSEPDCAAQLVWQGVAHNSSGDRVRPSTLGKPLGKGRISGCGGDAAYQVNVVRIRGVSPQVAVGVEGNDWPYAWLARGYILESPIHPLHDSVFGSVEKPDAEEGFDCGRTRAIRVRALTTPAFDTQPLTVEAEDDQLQSFLLREDVDGIVTLDAHSVVSGFARDGIPFLQAGDEFSLTLRECVGKATEAGLAGLRKLVVKDVSPSAPPVV
jgi:hypothetical protein